MRFIEYYDRIHKQKLELEVTDEVALFLQSSYKEWERKQKEFHYRTMSLNTVIYSGESEDITLEETIAAPDEEDVMDCKQCKKKLEFFNIVWKVVDNLDKEKYDLIWDLFVEKKSQKEIAKEKGITESAVSQLKDTAINDLIYHFNFDETFKQTDFYKKYLEKEKKDFVKFANNLTKEELGNYIMNGVKDFTKLLSQVLKKSTILDKNIAGKDTISKANRAVKQTVEKLNPDDDKTKTIIIPENIFTKENIETITKNLTKFLK